MCDGKFCCCVSEVVAPYIGMVPQFVESSGEPQTSPFLKERCDTIQQKAVVVIVVGTCGAWVCVMILEAVGWLRSQ